MADTGKPLMRLKDLLELDCDSCSAAGFRCYPRRLGEPSPPVSLSFCRSPSSLGRSSRLSHISRSLSRRLRGSFWWRRGTNEEEEPDEDAAEHGCGYEPDTSPSESSDSSGTRRTARSRSESSDSEFSSASSAAADAGDERHEDAAKKMGAAGREEGSSSGSEADDKEQLSPVAVMDFPCFDDDCSPSSDDSLLSLLQAGGRKAHKIRRFGSLDELGPVDLEARLVASQDADDQRDATARQLPRHPEETTPPSPTSSSRRRRAGAHEEHDENGLLVLLTETVSRGVGAVSERLLLDFFVEMKVERAGLRAPAGSLRQTAPTLGDGEILAEARGWLLDGAGWGLEDVLRGGKAVMAEMERGRRWMQVREEEREVGLVVAGVLTDQLVDEVITDLLV